MEKGSLPRDSRSVLCADVSDCIVEHEKRVRVSHEYTPKLEARGQQPEKLGRCAACGSSISVSIWSSIVPTSECQCVGFVGSP